MKNLSGKFAANFAVASLALLASCAPLSLARRFNLDVGPIEGTMNDPARLESNGIKIPYHEAVEKLLPYADIFFVGDTDHNSQNLTDNRISPKSMVAYIEGCASIFLFEGYTGEAVETYKKLKSHLEKLSEIGSPSITEKNKIEVYGVDPQTEDEKKAIIVDSRSNETGKVVSTLKTLYQRLKRDLELAQNIVDHASKDSRKVVVFYGSLHGSSPSPKGSPTYDGMPELFVENNLSCIRIDVYENKQEYEKDRIKDHERNAFWKSRFPDDAATISYGGDLPEFVYFLDTETLHFTDETPQHLRQIFESDRPALVPL